MATKTWGTYIKGNIHNFPSEEPVEVGVNQAAFVSLPGVKHFGHQLSSQFLVQLGIVLLVRQVTRHLMGLVGNQLLSKLQPPLLIIC